MNNIDICTFDVKSDFDFKFDFDYIEDFLQRVLKKLSIDNWNVSVVFCSNSFIQNLNKTYRGKDEPTDVLSFAQQDINGEWEPCAESGNAEAGDIVISLEYLSANAAAFGVSETEELQRLLIHGLLHLKGMDHSTNEAGEEMLLLGERLLLETQNG
ncbi:MAG: rRNA maturation RNase YbeY [Termitinemataceae bacterium]|nr:MAG: rRNA maturation RNase YbeY [Termitinemataceae bacterium]